MSDVTAAGAGRDRGAKSQTGAAGSAHGDETARSADLNRAPADAAPLSDRTPADAAPSTGRTPGTTRPADSTPTADPNRTPANAAPLTDRTPSTTRPADPTPPADPARGHSAATLYEASAGAARAVDPALRPVWPGARVAGTAFTVQGIGGDNLALHRAVAEAPAGSVLVVDLQGARHGHWGEILAVAAQQRGILGLVTDGGVRDTAELAELGFPVFARHITVVGTGKEHPGVSGVPVRVGDVVVRSGDLVVGDGDGVVVVPAEAVARTLERSDARVAEERKALDAVRGGATTLDLYRLG